MLILIIHGRGERGRNEGGGVVFLTNTTPPNPAAAHAPLLTPTRTHLIPCVEVEVADKKLGLVLRIKRSRAHWWQIITLGCGGQEVILDHAYLVLQWGGWGIDG